jgi:uncharacterized protein
LVEKGANVDHQTNLWGYYALHLAAAKGQIETVRMLLKHGANPALLNANGKTPLQVAGNNIIKKRQFDGAKILE